jgi:hypothetical protein
MMNINISRNHYVYVERTAILNPKLHLCMLTTNPKCPVNVLHTYTCCPLSYRLCTKDRFMILHNRHADPAPFQSFQADPLPMNAHSHLASPWPPLESIVSRTSKEIHPHLLKISAVVKEDILESALRTTSRRQIGHNGFFWR